MPTLYDIYPYSTEPLPEFQNMMRFPGQTDMVRFADAAMFLLGSDPTTTRFRQDGDEVRSYRDFVFSEGMMGISELAQIHAGYPEPDPLGIEIELSLAARPGDLTMFRDIAIRTPYSPQQLASTRLLRTFGRPALVHRTAEFTSPPSLLDFGVQDISEPEIATALSHMPKIDLDSPPSGLDIQPGTLAEDVAFAEFKDRTETHIDNLLQSGALAALAAESGITVETRHTVISQLTLRRLTRFLLSLA